MNLDKMTWCPAQVLSTACCDYRLFYATDVVVIVLVPCIVVAAAVAKIRRLLPGSNQMA